MQLITLSVDDVVLVHDEVIKIGGLPGLAGSGSLEGVLARVDNRVAYGLINDAFDLAATYAVVLATGHAFADANKRTAFKSMRVCLQLNGLDLVFEDEEAITTMVAVAQGHINEDELARWLRKQPKT